MVQGSPGSDFASMAEVPSDRKKVLVVDDEEQVRKLTSLILKQAGYEVSMACSGSAALAVLERCPGQVDLLLSDIEMPGMTGFELAQEVLAQERNIRILLVSGNPAYRQEVQVSFLEKPFSATDLRCAVAGILEGATVARSLGQDAAPTPELMAEVAERKPGHRLVWRVWPLLAATAAVLLILPFRVDRMKRESREMPDRVSLRAMRGAEGGAKVASGRRLRLDLDVSGLPQQDVYRLEMRTSGGDLVWRMTAASHGSEISTEAPALSAGIYLIRAHAPAGELLREYLLTVGESSRD